jgi:hypothetical protein
MIEQYSFGSMVVRGKTYVHDIKIFTDRVVPQWWRKEGHRLLLEDMEDVLEANPKTIIVGRGFYSVMSVSEEVKEYCRKKGIRLIELPTGQAWKKYNELQGEGVIGLFHLTC